jgi:Enhancer of polycomb-like
MADSVCSYDLDQLDEAWLKEFNGERGMCGLSPVNEEQFERIIEELEVRIERLSNVAASHEHFSL